MVRAGKELSHSLTDQLVKKYHEVGKLRYFKAESYKQGY